MTGNCRRTLLSLPRRRSKPLIPAATVRSVQPILARQSNRSASAATRVLTAHAGTPRLKHRDGSSPADGPGLCVNATKLDQPVSNVESALIAVDHAPISMSAWFRRSADRTHAHRRDDGRAHASDPSGRRQEGAAASRLAAVSGPGRAAYLSGVDLRPPRNRPAAPGPKVACDASAFGCEA